MWWLSGLVLVGVLAGVCSGSRCSCENGVPLEQVVETLSRSLAGQVAGHHRVRQQLVALIQRQVWARSSGREGSVRVHLTGPSGVGKSFLTKLVATSQFEESAAYTGYRAAGLAATTAATTVALATKAASTSAALSATGALTTALAAAPLAASGAALAAAAGWRLVEFGDAFWSVEPRPFPTQCGVAWWKFTTGDGAEVVDRALAHAVRALRTCASAVLVFEDVNRLPPEALARLEKLAQPVLRHKRTTVSLGDATVLLTSDLYLEDDDAPPLEEGASYDDASAVVEAQSRRMWRADPPSWWTLGVVTLPLPPLDDADLDLAISLYLTSEVSRSVRDALRFRFATESSYFYFWSSSRHDRWTGSIAFDDQVVDHVRDFVRRGPDNWRCHAITHFHATVVEPAVDDAVALLLANSQTEGPYSAVVYTSSLLLRITPRPVSPGTPLERLVYDASWDLLHLAPRADTRPSS
ncbi:hypothetical protein CTAYLR_003713 [Chrysophaeum taylorii]|uniref:Uncharacterized protein n=1 Tax=Chrysophaeum taylorii TaxID=2483200 RepID=A0AAD7UNU4_9STRA|nr:hypothetical protein CTAYLR_003713 [Chrysophaeum taylorii]